MKLENKPPQWVLDIIDKHTKHYSKFDRDYYLDVFTLAYDIGYRVAVYDYEKTVGIGNGIK